MRVVYPGSFDPPHYGHIDIIRRASSIFEKVIVAVGVSYTKKACFSQEERVLMLREVLRGVESVEVLSFNGLLVDFVKRVKADAILRSVRLFADFEYELLIALNNKKLANVETIFMMPSQEYLHLSSTIVKEIAKLGGNLDGLVPPVVKEKLLERFKP